VVQQKQELSKKELSEKFQYLQTYRCYAAISGRVFNARLIPPYLQL